MTCTITINRGRLLCALKATIPFVCQDPTRFHLATISVEIVDPTETLRLVATDGHTLARVHVATGNIDGSHPRQVLLRTTDARALVKALAGRKAELETTVMFAIENDLDKIVVTVGAGSHSFVGVDAKYLPYDQVIPKYSGSSGQSPFGVSPKYLARVGDAVRAFGREDDSSVALRLSFGDPLDPVRCDFASADLGEFTAVIMPMRL